MAPAAEVSEATIESSNQDPESLEPAQLDVSAAEPTPAEPKAAEETLSAENSAAESPGPDSLEVAIAQVDPGHWIRAIDPDPERGTLQLVLAAPFTALPEAQQLQQAETWQTQAQALGFDRLELTDRQGRPIGRQARVGSGMILLTPQHLS